MSSVAKKKPAPRPAPEPEPRDPAAMTGAQFAKARDAFGWSQAKMAEELGVGLRTVIRFEASANRDTDIPLSHAKHVRCLARVNRIKL